MDYEQYLGADVRKPDYLIDEKGFLASHPFFVDVVCMEYDISSPYQIGIACSNEQKAMLLPESTIEEIEIQFWKSFINHKLEDKLSLLNYHLKCYVDRQGSIQDFINWVEYSLATFILDKSKWESTLKPEILELNKKLANTWLAENRSIKTEVKINPSTFENSKENVLNMEISKIVNNFDGVNINKVYTHFHYLVEKGHISKSDLIRFITAAFQDQNPPKDKFGFMNTPLKNKITHIFYLYYGIAGKRQGAQSKYAALLGEYFEGYKTQTVISNFSALNKSKLQN